MARKMKAAHKKKIGDIMRAARKRKPTGRKVKFTPTEKSTLREVMTQHSGSRKSASTRTKRAAPKRKRKSYYGATPSLRRKVNKLIRGGKVGSKVGRKAGYKHSAATRAKMSKTHKARHRKARR